LKSKIYQPIFIIGSYRGGTSLLFRLLSESNELWSLYRESNHLWQDYHRHPQESSDTVILEKIDAKTFRNLNTDELVDVNQARKDFDRHYDYSTYNSYALGYLGRVRFLRDKMPWLFDLMNAFNGLYKFLFVRKYRLVDKTPPNIYRIEFLKAIYPDAKFIYLTRDGKDNINSLINAWCHKSKFKYPYRKYLTEDVKLNIEGYQQGVWKFYIPRGWKNYINKSIEEVCAYQWLDAHQAALKAFANLDTKDYMQIRFEEFLARPDLLMQRICDFCNIDYSKKMRELVAEMPPVNTDTDAKKHSNSIRIDKIEPLIADMQKSLGYNQHYYEI